MGCGNALAKTSHCYVVDETTLLTGTTAYSQYDCFGSEISITDATLEANGVGTIETIEFIEYSDDSSNALVKPDLSVYISKITMNGTDDSAFNPADLSVVSDYLGKVTTISNSSDYTVHDAPNSPNFVMASAIKTVDYTFINSTNTSLYIQLVLPSATNLPNPGASGRSYVLRTTIRRHG